jgi:hypothetical protein
LAGIGRATPILARANDWNLFEVMHVQQITIHADQQRAFTGGSGTQYWYVGGISANIGRQISGFYDKGDATKERCDRVGLALGETEFLEQLSGQLFEYKFGSHQFMVQQDIF